jgi:hypothetical protein
MDSSTALSAKSSPVDLYYQDVNNSLVQSIPVVYDTRFRQDFATLGSGQNVLYIPPSNGINKVCVVLEYLPAQMAGCNAGCALPRGWGYNASTLFSWRISGSQQYFATGAQLLASNLRKCRTKTQRDAILSLGGQECKLNASLSPPVNDFLVPQRAYIPLSFFTTPSNDGLDCPVASDILGSQIQVTVQIAPASSFWVLNSAWAGAPPVLPSAFNSAYFQVEQLSMMDRGMSLASRPKVDMDTETYVQSLSSFDQQVLEAPLIASSATQTVNLNGFMSGQVRGIQCYLVDNASINRNMWTVPDSIRCIFAGQVYAQYENGSSRIWNLIDGTAPSAVDGSVLTPTASGFTSVPALSEYALLPFSQPTHNDFESDIMVSGLRITNGSVQLQIVTPDATKAYTLYAIPILNASLAYSRGSATLLIG